MLASRHSHSKLRSYFSLLYSTIKMARDPNATESVYDVEDSLRHNEATAHFLEYVKRDPDVCGLIEERYLNSERNLDMLITLPEGSLGHEFAMLLKNNGFDPDYYRKIDVKDEVDYVQQRIRETHDIWHVVTGINVDEVGEVALKTFEYAQTRRPMSAYLVAAAVIAYLQKDPDKLGDLVETISKSYRLGKSSRPLLAMKWEQMWDRPVADIRKQLNLEAEAT